MSETMVHILTTLGWIVFGAFAAYCKSSQSAQKVVSKVKGKAPSLIAQAEREYASATKAGGQKLTWVINRLYVYVPKWLKPFLTRKMIEKIVQTAFDGAQAYAYTQLDKLAERAVESDG